MNILDYVKFLKENKCQQPAKEIWIEQKQAIELSQYCIENSQRYPGIQLSNTKISPLKRVK